MIDHFLVKIDRDNKSNHGFAGRAYRNVPKWSNPFSFSVFSYENLKLLIFTLYIYVQIPIQTILAWTSRCAMKMELTVYYWCLDSYNK
jgi:hypothetical protein